MSRGVAGTDSNNGKAVSGTKSHHHHHQRSSGSYYCRFLELGIFFQIVFFTFGLISFLYADDSLKKQQDGLWSTSPSTGRKQIGIAVSTGSSNTAKSLRKKEFAPPKRSLLEEKNAPAKKAHHQNKEENSPNLAVASDVVPNQKNRKERVVMTKDQQQPVPKKKSGNRIQAGDNNKQVQEEESTREEQQQRRGHLSNKKQKPPKAETTSAGSTSSASPALGLGSSSSSSASPPPKQKKAVSQDKHPGVKATSITNEGRPKTPPQPSTTKKTDSKTATTKKQQTTHKDPKTTTTTTQTTTDQPNKPLPQPSTPEKKADSKTATTTKKKQFNEPNSPTTETKLKCTTWEGGENLDDWWQDHPTWDISVENSTHFCFAPITNPIKANLLATIHDKQFPKDTSTNKGGGCNDPVIQHIWNFGFSAQMYQYSGKLFWAAYKENKVFVPGELNTGGHQWLYSPPYPPPPDYTNGAWASCPTKDYECYFLPVTDCNRTATFGKKDTHLKKKYDHELFGIGKQKPNITLQEHALWVASYQMRLRQKVRHQLYKYKNKPDSGIPTFPIQTPCTWIHVRRGDAMTEKGYDRNFYSIQEYLTIGKVDPNDTVLLLTDDQSAIEEATLLHPEYNWVYFNKTRVRGPVQFNSHIPSKDPAIEVLSLLVEQEAASYCHKGVHGASNMKKHFKAGMIKRTPLTELEFVEMDKRLRKTRVDAQDFMQDLNKRLEDAKRKKNQKQTQTQTHEKQPKQQRQKTQQKQPKQEEATKKKKS